MFGSRKPRREDLTAEVPLLNSALLLYVPANRWPHTSHTYNKSKRARHILTWRKEEAVLKAVIKANQMMLKPRIGRNPDSSDVPTAVGKVQPEQRTACCWGPQVSGWTSPMQHCPSPACFPLCSPPSPPVRGPTIISPGKRTDLSLQESMAGFLPVPLQSPNKATCEIQLFPIEKCMYSNHLFLFHTFIYSWRNLRMVCCWIDSN